MASPLPSSFNDEVGLAFAHPVSAIKAIANSRRMAGH
jgi:hypothetical protein